MRILLGVIIPLIAVYLAWSIGSPPPKSIFWTTASGEVTAHETSSFETGYGPADFTNPVIRLDSGGTRKLDVKDVHDAEAVKAAWPVGTRVELRLNPDGETAISTDERTNGWNAWVISAGALFIIAFFVRSFFTESGGTELFLAGVGACFIMLPLILLRFMWNFGDPPAVSLFWPKETVEVVSNEITSRPWGGGRTAYTANIVVERADGAVVPLATSGTADDNAAEFSPGTQHVVKRSPQGQLYERTFQFPFLIAFFMSIIGPCAIVAGGWLISRIFVSPSKRP